MRIIRVLQRREGIGRGFLTCFEAVAFGLLLMLSTRPAVLAETQNDSGLRLNTGKQVYDAACVACHGPEGKGLPKSTVGFEPPGTFPDFTRCDQTTPEDNIAWKAVITNGGPYRGFSQIMPSFSEALTSEQIDLVIEYLRGFCRAAGWPRGELNLPRAFVTEKAYPENEVVVATALNAQGAPAVSNDIIYEQRFGNKNQIEVNVPVSFQRQAPGLWYGGFGDVALGLKRNLFSNLRSILSLQGEARLPTGNGAKGLGSGTPVFEAFAAFGQLIPARAFVQFQAGAELPVDTNKTPQAVYWRTVLGKSFNQGGGLGRMWSPMVEFLADHDLETGARTNWDVLPEMQVTISRRQHIRVNAGVRIPVSNTPGRSIQVLFYLLWDRQDGRLTEGW